LLRIGVRNNQHNQKQPGCPHARNRKPIVLIVKECSRRGCGKSVGRLRRSDCLNPEGA
jgi:hypothetical protein